MEGWGKRSNIRHGLGASQSLGTTSESDGSHTPTARYLDLRLGDVEGLGLDDRRGLLVQELQNNVRLVGWTKGQR